jgi:hypothetical protein
MPNFIRVSVGVADNGFRLCDVGEFEVQMFNSVQMPNRIPMLKFSTSAPISQNRCCA